jgi:hypothetical protein
MFRRVLAAAFVASALTATPVTAQDPSASLAQDLSSCAGAVAAVGNLNVVTHPQGASGEWSEVLTRILERLATEPGVEGMTGRYAGSAAKDFWSEQPRAEREAAANACRDRFGGA